MTDIMERVQQAVAEALEADAEAQKAEEANRAINEATQKSEDDARAKARQDRSRVAMWDARRRHRKPPTPGEGGTPLSVVTAILDGKEFSTAPDKAAVIAANSREALADGVGDWWALPIINAVYRAHGGSYFTRHYRTLEAVTVEKAMTAYSALPYKLDFELAFPGVTAEAA